MKEQSWYKVWHIWFSWLAFCILVFFDSGFRILKHEPHGLRPIVFRLY